MLRLIICICCQQAVARDKWLLHIAVCILARHHSFVFYVFGKDLTKAIGGAGFRCLGLGTQHYSH
jgi:hypothetical protein